MRLFAKLSIVFALLFFQTIAIAGSRSGPYVIWVNLSDNKGVTDFISKRAKADTECLPPTAMVYINARPPGITDELVAKAVLKGDVGAIKLLNNFLRHSYDDLEDGFDGLIAYDEIAGPRLSRMVTGRKLIKRTKIPTAKDLNPLWDGFCDFIPPIVRPI